MNKRRLFCDHLADWLHHEEWHFTTSLAACIGAVKDLPDDADALIHQLLLRYPEKPAKKTIVEFLINDVRVHRWFRQGSATPKVTSFLLQGRDTCLPRTDRGALLETVPDVAAWLDVSETQLDWLADFKRYDANSPQHLRHYHYSLAEKRNGSFRLIESPKSILKRAQRKINEEILCNARMHEAAHGFRRGRSCKTHAALHVGKEYLFLFDIADCFLSTQWSVVYRVFSELSYPRAVARYLTGLCTHKGHANDEVLKKIDQSQKALFLQRHLPQGAPSSPALSNAVFARLDSRLGGLARSLDLAYSRYADDLAFSGDVHRDWTFLEPLVGSICLEQGFSLNFRKTRLMRPRQRQKVTGIVVNEKPNIDRRYYDRLKAVLTNCAHHGMGSQNRSNHPDFRAHLLGSIQHVKSLNSAKGEKLELLFKKIR